MSTPYKTSHFSVLVTMGQRDEDIQAQILIVSVHLYKDPFSKSESPGISHQCQLHYTYRPVMFISRSQLSCTSQEVEYKLPEQQDGSAWTTGKSRRLHGLALRLNRTAALTAQKTLKIPAPLAGRAHKHNSCRRQEKDSLLFQVPDQKQAWLKRIRSQNHTLFWTAEKILYGK